MKKPIITGELSEPRFMQEGYEYLGEDGEWHIKEDAPEWAKKEFKEFYEKIASDPDENGIITQY